MLFLATEEARIWHRSLFSQKASACKTLTLFGKMRQCADSNDAEDGNINAWSISELMLFLKSTFRAKDFAMAEAVLTARDKNAKLEIDALKEEIEVLKRKSEEERLEKIAVEVERRRCENEYELMRDRLRNAEERCDKLLEEVKRMTEQNKELIDFRSKSLELECAKAKAEGELQGMMDIKRRNRELECGKAKAETQAKAWRNRCDDLHERVSRLEKDVEDWQNDVRIDVLNDKQENVERCEKKMSINGNAEADKGDVARAPGLSLPVKVDGNLQTGENGRSSSQRFMGAVHGDDDCATGVISTPKASTLQTSAVISNSSQADVQIKTKTLKRKWAEIFDSGENKNVDNGYRDKDIDDNMTFGKCEIKRLQMPNIEAGYSSHNHCLVNTVSSGNDKVDSNSTPANSKQNLETLRQCQGKLGCEPPSQDLVSKFALVGFGTEYEVSSDSCDSGSDDDDDQWLLESDIIAAFRSDIELCMKAVCALHRMQKSEKRSPLGLSYSNRGFDKSDVSRGTALAKFLIDGDPEGKLRKTVSELQKYDPKSLDDCRRLAIQHSKQLFEIYQKKEDIFFPYL